MGFKSGTNQWARGRMAADNADSISTDATGHLQVLSHNIAFNGTSWDRVRSAGTNSDALATTTVGTVYSNSFSGCSLTARPGTGFEAIRQTVSM